MTSTNNGEPKAMSTNGPPSGRTRLHERRVSYDIFHRAEDSLWDLEASLVDLKHVQVERFPGVTQVAGAPVHHLKISMTLDDDFRIVAVGGQSPVAPFDDCASMHAPLQRLVGARLGRGWRQTISEAMGGEGGCTHLRELLIGAATAGIQGITGYRDQMHNEQGRAPLTPADSPPGFLGQCVGWRLDGPTVAWLFPRFVRKAE